MTNSAVFVTVVMLFSAFHLSMKREPGLLAALKFSQNLNHCVEFGRGAQCIGGYRNTEAWWFSVRVSAIGIPTLQQMKIFFPPVQVMSAEIRRHLLVCFPYGGKVIQPLLNSFWDKEKPMAMP